MSKTLAFVGDVHSNLFALNKLLDERPYIKKVIQVGDLGLYYSRSVALKDGDWKKYSTNIERILDLKPKMNKEVYFIKGNHEHFQMLKSPLLNELNISYIPQGEVQEIGDYKIGFLGGIYSPNYINKKSDELKGRNLRFYTNEDLNRLRKNAKTGIDILVTHEGPKGYINIDQCPQNKGTKPILSLMKDLKPKYHIHGHHHYNYEGSYKTTKIIGLGSFNDNKNSFKLI